MADTIAVVDEHEFEQLLSLKREHALYTCSVYGETFLAEIVQGANLPLRSWYITREFKSRNRVHDKVVRKMGESSALGLGEILDTQIKDYTGGRIIVHYISYLDIVYECFSKIVEARDEMRFGGDLDRFVEEPAPGGTGWRGLKRVIEFEIEPSLWFPFEVQFLTFLQHDWDQKQHPIYEDPEDVQETIRNLYARWSDELYEIDKDQDAVRERLVSFRKGKGSS